MMGPSDDDHEYIEKVKASTHGILRNGYGPQTGKTTDCYWWIQTMFRPAFFGDGVPSLGGWKMKHFLLEH